jgi:hypothetical protein
MTYTSRSLCVQVIALVYIFSAITIYANVFLLFLPHIVTA